MNKLIMVAITLLAFTSCTENQRARNFGGTEKVSLKPNEKLINVTWKNDDMWVLTEDTLTNEVFFRESSSFGIWQGEVIIK